MPEVEGSAANQALPDRIPVETAYSADFKRGFIDGAFGRVKENVLHATFYSELPPAPRAYKRVTAEDNRVVIGPEEIEIVPADLKFVRRAEFECYMTKEVLESVLAWLSQKLAQMDQMKDPEARPREQ